MRQVKGLAENAIVDLISVQSGRSRLDDGGWLLVTPRLRTLRLNRLFQHNCLLHYLLAGLVASNQLRCPVYVGHDCLASVQVCRHIGLLISINLCRSGRVEVLLLRLVDLQVLACVGSI